MSALGFFKLLREDVDAVILRDPAARSRIEVALFYPSFHAMVFYRVAHPAWRRGWIVVARGLSQMARFLTGIEIHPGARIGRRFFIDHGMGVVIGETAEIGDDVTLYHDVTLGGISPSENAAAQRDTKRHPTLEDGVIVGSGAQVLGPITVGRGARVGANAVVVKPVPACATVVGVPARQLVSAAPSEVDRFVAYGTPTGDLPDPVARAIEGLLDHVSRLQARVDELERRRPDAPATTVSDPERPDAPRDPGPPS